MDFQFFEIQFVEKTMNKQVKTDKKPWNLRVDSKQGFLAIIVVESQGLPTMKCQTKCVKAIFGGRFLWDGWLARAARPSKGGPSYSGY